MVVSTPVVFSIFNRPETTARVFDEIAHAQPRALFIVADGPRADHPSDVEQVKQTRAIVERISWFCNVNRNYSETNMGLKMRISSGLDWVFERAEEAIILEDDNLPHPSFFPYCQALLAYYRNNPRIMHISGDSFLSGAHPIENSYYFSRYPHTWGWATWRRAWATYDVNMKKWLADPSPFLSQFEDSQEREFWRKAWDDVTSAQICSWAYPWVFACQAHDGLCINPVCNLVSNIGFGPDAIHTKETDELGNKIPVEAMLFPLQHPNYVQRDTTADRILAEMFFQRRRTLSAASSE